MKNKEETEEIPEDQETKKPEEEDEVIEGAHELFAKTLKIYSEDEENINRDFIISNLDDDLFSSKLMKFVTRRIIYLNELKTLFRFALKKKEDLKNMISEKDYNENKQFYEDLIEIQTKSYKDLRSLILGEIRPYIIISRAKYGFLLKSIIKANLPKIEAEEIMKELEKKDQKQTLMEKLFGRKKQNL